MSRISRDNRPNLKPVKKIELDDKNLRLRLIGTVLLLAIGVSLLAYAVSLLLHEDAGWTEIDGGSSAQSLCGEMTLIYNLGTTEASVKSERRAVANAYADLAQKAYRIFSPNEEFAGVGNLYRLNSNVGQTVELDKTLYDAIKLMQEHDSRALYMAPLYDNHRGLCMCSSDTEAESFDPLQGKDAAQYVSQLVKFISDENAVSVELLDDQKARLTVSDEYMAYAKQYGITSFVDFGWMTNAFAVDFIADKMLDSGYKNGVLSSCDGFVRNFDQAGDSFALDLYDRVGSGLYTVAALPYKAPLSAVYMRVFPLTEIDAQQYYFTEKGEVRTPYIGLSDGLSKAAASSIAAYSGERSCAEVLISVMPVYVADSIDPSRLRALKADGISYVYCFGSELHYNNPDTELQNVYDFGDITYKPVLDK